MPPCFARPPMIQKTLSKDSSAFSAASALVALESLTRELFPFADLFQAMREPWKCPQNLSLRDRVRRRADPARRPPQPRSGHYAPRATRRRGKVGDLDRAAFGSAHDVRSIEDNAIHDGGLGH